MTPREIKSVERLARYLCESELRERDGIVDSVTAPPSLLAEVDTVWRRWETKAIQEIRRANPNFGRSYLSLHPVDRMDEFEAARERWEQTKRRERLALERQHAKGDAWFVSFEVYDRRCREAEDQLQGQLRGQGCPVEARRQGGRA